MQTRNKRNKIGESNDKTSKKVKKNNNYPPDSDSESDLESLNLMNDFSEESEIEEDEIDKQIIKTISKKKDILNTYMKCKNIIKNRELSIIDILDSDLSLDKKSTLIEKYKSLKYLHPFSEEYIYARDTLTYEYYKFLDENTKPVIRISKPVDVSDIFVKRDEEEGIFKNKIKELIISQENNQNKIALEQKLKEYIDFKCNDEKSKLKRWISTALTLPYDKVVPPPSNISLKIEEVKNYLNDNLYGMDKVKERILLFLNKKLTLGDSKGCNIALIGQPGTGKTSIIKALSKCLGIPFSQINSGGLSSSDFLLGHDFTYSGSREGEISRCLIRNGVKNGIFFFDEFEKVSQKKDVLATLLHITDFSQNYEFRDSYFADLKQDLSKTWFIFSMNELPADTALLDRLEVIKVDSYTVEERRKISRDYIIPKFLKDMKIDENTFNKKCFTEESIEKIVSISKGEGIRNIERNVNLILEKIFFFINQEKEGIDYKYEWWSWLKKNKQGDLLIVKSSFVDLVLKSCNREEVFNNMYL